MLNEQQENLVSRKQFLETEIATLEKDVVDNLRIGKELLAKEIITEAEFNNFYLRNNQRMENKITEYRQELANIEQQLTQAQVIQQ